MEEACEYSDVCERYARAGHHGKCILHSEKLAKDKEAFEEAFEEHRKNNGSNFRQIVFPFEVSFSGAIFEDASFEDVVFGDMVHFSDVTFEGEVYFSGAIFEEASFENATYEGEVYFTDATFAGMLNSLNASFGNKAYFSGAIFEDRADFSGAIFGNVAHFSDATFVEGANFSNTSFEDRAIFFSASFEDGARFSRTSFSDATFGERADFFRASFEESASFRDANFEDVAIFMGASFENEADFSRTSFKDVASFHRSFETDDNSRFVNAKFDGCEFKARAIFSGSSESSRAFAGGEVSFRNIKVASDATLQFRYADLSRCRFLRTDLRDVEFTGVTWCRKFSVDGWFSLDWFQGKYTGEFTTHWFQRKKEWFHRVGLYDEIHQGASIEAEDGDETPRRWHEVERLYRQLKRNYEERGDFPRGGDFHIGEKEARRQGETSWGPWFLLTVYRALSKYGERALPALFWLVLLVVGCATGYLVMEASTESVTLGSFADWWKALVLSGEATLFPVQSAGFESFGPRALNLIQRGLSPILIALLALALRQRVKR